MTPPLLQSYLRASQANPMTVQAITGATIMAVGDATVQLGVESSDSLELKRLIVACLYSALLGPLLYKWYSLLDHVFPAAQLLQRIIVNQLVCSPVLPIFFLVWSGFMYGALTSRLSNSAGRREVASQTWRRLQTDFVPMVGTSFCVWLPANAFSFAFVPVDLRIAFMSCVSCGWGGYLSYMAHRRITSAGAGKEA